MGPNGEKTLIASESGHPVEWVEEQNYMFRLSNFQDRLIHWLTKNGKLIISVFPFINAQFVCRKRGETQTLLQNTSGLDISRILAGRVDFQANISRSLGHYSARRRHPNGLRLDGRPRKLFNRSRISANIGRQIPVHLAARRASYWKRYSQVSTIRFKCP